MDDNVLTTTKLPPISIDLIECGIAIHAGGTDKSGNYVIFFPTKKHAMIATQFAFGSQLVHLLQYLMGITMYTGVYRRKFTFYLDLRDMNYAAADSIIKALNNVNNTKTDSRDLIEGLLIVKPKDKKSLKALQKLIGAAKSKSDEILPVKPPYPIHVLNDIKDLHRKIDVSQLPVIGGGYMPYSHSHFVAFIKRFEETRTAVDCSMAVIDEVLDEMEKMNLADNSRSNVDSIQERKKRIDTCLKEIQMDEMSEKLNDYKSTLLDKSDISNYSQIPSSMLIELAITVIRDCLDEIKKRKERYKLLERQFNILLSPMYNLNQNAQPKDINGTRQDGEFDTGDEDFEPSIEKTSNNIVHGRMKSLENFLDYPENDRFHKRSPGLDMNYHRSMTNLAIDENDNQNRRHRYHHDNRQMDLATRRNLATPFIPISKSPQSISPEPPRNGQLYKGKSSTPSESLSRFKKRERERDFQKSAPNLNELGDDMRLVENGMQNQPIRGLHSSTTLDDGVSPLSNFSYQSMTGNLEENPYEVLPSPQYEPRRLWENDEFDSAVPQFLDERLESRERLQDPPPPSLPPRQGNRNRILGVRDTSEIGYELLHWFKTVGLAYLEENQVVPESSSDAEQKLNHFESYIEPNCLDKIDQSEYWLQISQDSVGRIWEELKAELESFRKSLQRVKHQYECVNIFFAHVRKAIHWYKMIMSEMPKKLLDKKKRPNVECLNHYANLTDDEHDQMKGIKQKYPHLSPAIANGINKHMIYITDFTIRMEARQLVQRCILVDKIINVYSQDSDDAIKAIYQNRRGPNSVPTPENSCSSLHLDDDSITDGVSPNNIDEELFHYSSANRGRARLPDKKSRHNRSLPSFSPIFNVSGVPDKRNSPVNSASPTYSQRSYLSSSSNASSSNNLSLPGTGINYISQRARHSRALPSSGSSTNLRGHAPMDAIHEHPT